jgi:hypothetical protein
MIEYINEIIKKKIDYKYALLCCEPDQYMYLHDMKEAKESE